MASATESDILLELATLEPFLLKCVQEDNVALFASRMSRFEEMLQQNVSKLDKETLSETQMASSRIAILASSFLDTELLVNDHTAVMKKEMETLLGEFQTLNLDAGHQRPTRDTSLLSTWLLENLHNPYPDFRAKRQFSCRLGLPGKTVDDWFTNARRKIGWTTFLRRHFKGSRALALDCAHRILIGGKGRRVFCQEVTRDLKEIKAVAEHLYGSSREGDNREPTGFAKELESIKAHMTMDDKPRKRRLSAFSRASEHSSASSDSSANSSSRMHSRASSEESDATLCSENLEDTLTLRPRKRGRSASFVSTISSPDPSDSSSSAYSFETNETVSEVITPVMSPTQSTLPLEIFDGWMNNVSKESAFLPHDVSDKPPPSVLSRKRASSDSDSEAPSKRVRFDDDDGGSRPRVGSKGSSTVEESGLSGVTTQDGPAPSSQMQSQPSTEPLCGVPSSGPSTTEQPTPVLDDDLTKDFLSQLDFSIPQPPLFDWDDCLFGGTSGTSIFEYSSLDFGNELCSGLRRDFGVHSDNVPSSQDSAVLSSEWAQQRNEGANSECSFSLENLKADAHRSGIGLNVFPGDLQSDSISFSEFDFSFLESLNGASRPCAADVQAPSADGDVFAPLVDIPASGPDLSDLDVFDLDKRPEGNALLLAEAQRIQQEVFG